jgi:hypothetical protein
LQQAVVDTRNRIQIKRREGLDWNLGKTDVEGIYALFIRAWMKEGWEMGEWAEETGM